MSAEFKKIAAREIEEFKADYRARFPGRDADDLTDEDLLREVMNTVGKPGKLGEHVRCVVSVSMLTEGWDANTVTHVLGVRAFGTQLLCEQVVGRALRRMSYAPNDDGPFRPRVCRGLRRAVLVHPVPRRDQDPEARPDPDPRPRPRDRIACEITFPRLLGYRYDLPGERLTADVHRPTRDSRSPTADIPTRTEIAPIVGESSVTRLDDLEGAPAQRGRLPAGEARSWRNTSATTTGNDKPWLFPQLLAIAKRWLAECVTCKDNTFPQLLLLRRARPRRRRPHLPGDRRVDRGRRRPSSPSCAPTTRVGTTRYVDFDTTGRPTRPAPTSATSPTSSPTPSWEQKMAERPGRHARGRPLRQEPQPRLHDPLHARRRRAPVSSPTSSSGSTTATAPTTR